MKAGNAASEGKDTHLAANMVDMGKGFIPFQNLWYTKAATDHILFQSIQEQLSPGYLAIMRANSLKQYRQDGGGRRVSSRRSGRRIWRGLPAGDPRLKGHNPQTN